MRQVTSICTILLAISVFTACGSSGAAEARGPAPGIGALPATSPNNTTVAAETGNNTSAASTYAKTANDNAVPGNVSKIPTNKLLYSGSTTKVYAELQGWFGQPNHMDVGYKSNDPVQVHKQVADAASRGLNGFILDWYGPTVDPVTQQTALLLKAEAEATPGFEFAIMEDAGAIRSCANNAGCNVTQALINDLTYAYNTFETSPAYMRHQGRPVVFFFNVNMLPNINWPQVRASVPGNPLFVEEYQTGSNAFAASFLDGGYGWPIINTSNNNDWGQAYLNSFYSAGMASAGKYIVGASYKGFNDALAAWTMHRVMSQQCGATYLSTFNQANSMFNATRQLDAMQIDTWNDYEEGTEIETGIDTCLSVNAGVSGGVLNFAPSGAGNESLTVDHYTVYASTDGQNLTKLADLPAGSRSLNLASYGIAPGTIVYVKMQAKPGFLNRMSGAVKF